MTPDDADRAIATAWGLVAVELSRDEDLRGQMMDGLVDHDGHASEREQVLSLGITAQYCASIAAGLLRRCAHGRPPEEILQELAANCRAGRRRTDG